jgi:uncharacterized protein (DUF2384 family)
MPPAPLKAGATLVILYRRHTAEDVRQLSPEQSGRAWKLAEILAKATSIFGSKEEAEQRSFRAWFRRRAGT